jgi:hypothetical protein
MKWHTVPSYTLLSLILSSFIGCGGGGGDEGSHVSAPPGAEGDVRTQWEAQMVHYGKIHCDALSKREGTFDEKLAATYYDAQAVFYRIADYTGDSAWLRCAERAEEIYRDRYLIPNNGSVPGYWNFSEGLAKSYLRTGDERSREAVFLLRDFAAFSSREEIAPHDAPSLSREIAYALETHLNGEDLGGGSNPRRDLLVQRSLDALDAWGEREPVYPFMVGLTAEALIRYDERIGDPRILPALTRAGDWLWERAWVPDSRAFVYVTAPDSEGNQRTPAPDLNLLIAPLYAWLSNKTGEAHFTARGDAIFAGGVRSAFLGNPKQFNQNYRWSFDYVRWRR